MITKTSELTGAALDYAVAKCLCPEHHIVTILNGIPRFFKNHEKPFKMIYSEPLYFSTDWTQGGPIIEREGISLINWKIWEGGGTEPSRQGWEASYGCEDDESGYAKIDGPTPLIAAMRCYVASKLGKEVDIPEGLL